MKVARNWLKELVDLKVSEDELIRLLPLRAIGTKEITPEFIELDMKGYNRADLLSLRGVAYEVSAITDSEVKFAEPDPTKYVWVEQSLPKVEVKVEDEDLCPLYCIAKIEGLKVAPSDKDWIQKLSDSGMRQVNNVADVTNLVMLEYGQPLHSFDAKEVKDETLIVRRASEGEKLKTLDEKERTLTSDDLLITDSQRALGIAGVMGGKNSEITDSTTTILLEAAIFDPVNLRKTSGRLGLNSEASKRFYHGLTKKRALQALDAAIRMYEGLGGKLTALTIVGDTEDQAKKVILRLNKVNSLIGVEITERQVEEFLGKLNFSSSRVANAPSNNNRDFSSSEAEPSREVSWVVTPPYWRLDIEIEEDLIEEVARMYGYEKIPAKKLEGELPEKIDQSLFNLIYELKNKLVAEGFTELQTYSYFSTNILNNFNFDKTQLIKIANPMSAETEYMRNNLWANLVEKAADNLKYFENVAIFEIGKTYEATTQPLSSGDEVVEGKIQEEYRLAILLVDGTDNPLAQLNQVIKAVLNKISPFDTGRNPNFSYFHPTRHTALGLKDQPIGGMAEVHPRILGGFGVQKRVAIAEIKLEPLRGAF
jgi:phenylalanyl-tRNA synthetase beta chain